MEEGAGTWTLGGEGSPRPRLPYCPVVKVGLGPRTCPHCPGTVYSGCKHINHSHTNRTGSRFRVLRQRRGPPNHTHRRTTVTQQKIGWRHHDRRLVQPGPKPHVLWSGAIRAGRMVCSGACLPQQGSRTQKMSTASVDPALRRHFFVSTQLELKLFRELKMIFRLE